MAVTNRGRTLRLGGTRVDLKYFGPNHSDSTLVVSLPQDKIIFVVDLIPVGSMPGRGLIDFYPLEAEDAIKKIIDLDWERLIPGHPSPDGRLGTKEDAKEQLAILQAASAAIKPLAREGKCWEPAENELKLEKYASWPGYENSMRFLGRRYCGLWGRGT
jgi:glyoxylase-like metal-dependent hydrolase (beta-lactamase superfamily II)